MPRPPLLPFAPSSNVASIAESATIAVSARARALKAAGRAVIDLGAGEPDFPTPAHVAVAGQRAIEMGRTRYTAVEGIPELRAVIAALASERFIGDGISADDVVVSTGSKQSLFNACFAVFGEGDEVLIPTPAWTSYYEMVRLARATPTAVHGGGRSLLATAAELARASTGRTRGLILNSPCNPTGSVYPTEELRAILALAAARGWWVICDEIYRAISYGAAVPSVLELVPDRSRLVVVDGVAKSHAMTGWRIGWSIAPREVARSMCALQSHTTANASTISQYATLSALTEREASARAIAEMVTTLRSRRDQIQARLDDAGVRYVPPDGAFYFLIHAGSATPDDPEPGTRFARELLDARDVAVVPGAAFGVPEWIRMSFAAPIEPVLEGVARIIAALTARP